MKSYHWDELESVTMRENFLRKLVAGERLTIARTETEKGSYICGRCYPHEAFIIIIDGLWKVQVDGRMILLGANQLLHLPPFMEHDVEALDHTLTLEILAQPDPTHIGLMEFDLPIEDENYLWGV
jgi:quercetin dioxygenase-like cupin family protein